MRQKAASRAKLQPTHTSVYYFSSVGKKNPFNNKVQEMNHDCWVLPLQELVLSFHLCNPHKEVSMLFSYLKSKHIQNLSAFNKSVQVIAKLKTDYL